MEKQISLNEELVQSLIDYGIMKNENEFNDKIKAMNYDVNDFLQNGKTLLILENDEEEQNSYQFKIEDNKLLVQQYAIKSEANQLSDFINKTKTEVGEDLLFLDLVKRNNKEEVDLEKKVFLKTANGVREYDLLQDANELKGLIENDYPAFNNKFKVEIEQMQSFLQDKIEHYPELAKDITENMNVLSNIASSISMSATDDTMKSKQNKTIISDDINDYDTYEQGEAIQKRNNEKQEKNNSRGFSR